MLKVKVFFVTAKEICHTFSPCYTFKFFIIPKKIEDSRYLKIMFGLFEQKMNKCCLLISHINVIEFL